MARKQTPAKTKSQPKAKAKSTGKPGRPAGSKTIPRQEVEVVVSRCKVCHSTNRTRYGNPIVQEATGTDPQGKPFTHVVARPTQCTDCGQARRDIAWLFDPGRLVSEIAQELDSSETSNDQQQ